MEGRAMTTIVVSMTMIMIERQATRSVRICPVWSLGGVELGVGSGFRFFMIMLSSMVRYYTKYSLIHGQGSNSMVALAANSNSERTDLHHKGASSAGCQI